MGLSVTCDCGAKTQVNPTLCGSAVACDCGKMVSVPSLSELRRISGLASVPIGVSDRLFALYVDGLLPTESECVSCGCPTKEYLGCMVECERMFATKPSYLSYFLQSLFAPLWILATIRREYDNAEVHGRELIVKTPVRLCGECFSKSKMSPRICRELLQKSDLYAKLLSAYPDAILVWETALSSSN